MHIQVSLDNTSNEIIGEVLGGHKSGLCDSSLAINAIIRLLQFHFPPDNGFCDIEFYCLACNFGNVEGMEYFSPEQLYDKLNKAKSDEWSRKYREERMSCDCRTKQKRCLECHVWEYEVKPNKK